jgi:predicted nuclease of predicted toxin-antitoxin system
MIGFIVDQQLPTALARWLSANGMNALHIKDLGKTGAKDDWIWRYALDNGRCIITKDADFHARFSRSGRGPRIVWFRCPNASRNETVLLFARRWIDVRSALDRGVWAIEIDA